MSVLIRGMEMPKNCFDCPCYHHKVDDGYYDYEICRASGTVFNDGYSSVTGHKDHIDPFKARLDNCPLFPVPPHGRLIDGDKLAEEQKENVGAYHANLITLDDLAECLLKQSICEDYAPTIIPAEPFNNLSKPCKDDEDIPICTKASPASLGIYEKAEEGE